MLATVATKLMFLVLSEPYLLSKEYKHIPKVKPLQLY
jgi:hypothetical protein